jgi:glycerol-3-phosphate O-acyltransferase
LCYAFERDQLLDKLVLEDLCVERDWHRPFQAMPGISAPGGDSCLALRGFSGLVFRRAVPRDGAELSALVQWAQDHPNIDIKIVPVVVFWGRSPQRTRSWLKLLVAEGWNIAGRTRRFFAFLVHGRDVLIKLSEPVSLQQLVREELGLARTARKTGRLLRIHFARQRMATIGPDLSHRRLLVNEVVASPGVRAAMRRQVASGKISERKARHRARRLAREVAADYSYAVVRIFDRALTALWNRLYDGIDVAHLESLERVAPGSEVVYVPCHRSHFDYLLLSYVVLKHGLAVPHIAAGINLNLPLIGPVLRRGGAFFLRRSFGGDALYTAVFKAYLGAILSKGFPVEYFIEGTRSRTGRLLKPKAGLLAMTVQHYVSDHRRPVVFAPVYFGYEKLIEGETFLGELRGRSKQKESIGGFFRSLGGLRGEFGRVAVNFGEPIELGQWLDGFNPNWRTESIDSQFRPAWLNRAVEALGERILISVNEAAALSPIGLVSLVVLAMPKQAIVETELLGQLELLLALAKNCPYTDRVTVTEMDTGRIIAHCQAMGWLKRRRHALGDVLFMDERRAVLASYFRNNILHLFVMPALIAGCLTNRTEISRERVLAMVGQIFPFISAELFLDRTQPIEPNVEDAVAAMVRVELLDPGSCATAVARPASGTIRAAQLRLCAQLVAPFLERYYLAIAMLEAAAPGGATRAGLVERCRQAAEQLSLIYDLNSPDLFDDRLFRNFIDILLEEGLAQVDDENRLQFKESLAELGASLGTLLSPQVRQTLLQLASAAPAGTAQQTEI